MPYTKMSIRNFHFSIDEHYHIYNRGTDKRDIFLGLRDYDRFLALLYLCNSKNSVDLSRHFRDGKVLSDLYSLQRGDKLVDIGAYCLMPNHFHLLLREKEEGGITKFMGKLATAYSMYFNKKYDRTGALFEGKFKAKHVDSDEYLKYLFAYIHLNPVKLIDPKWKENGINDREVAKRYLQGYRYSSYLEYLGVTRQENSIIKMSSFPEYFVKPEFFESFVDDWLSYHVVQGKALHKKVVANAS